MPYRISREFNNRILSSIRNNYNNFKHSAS